jgi:hypothetical protein
MLVIQELKRLMLKTQNLEQYNQYLTRLIDEQQNEVDSYISQIKGVKETRQGIVPLMLAMLDSLSAFIQLDSPFLAQERQDRLLQLQNMINKADISEAEKYRRILEAYQIEADYGRIVFCALSLDRKQVWLWSRSGIAKNCFKRRYETGCI